MVKLVVSESPEMKSIVDIVDRIAKSNINVIVTGESGTGKELIARQIHQQSSRSSGPFVIVNCPSLSEDLFDSNLFGHVKGSFTSASSDREGYIEAANGGTIYLDEITALSLNMQAKLLRFAQSGEYNRVGETSTKKADVRIISSTNKKLENEIKNGTLREDLFYRLNTIVLRVPPLRKRKEDIEKLVEEMFDSRVKGISPDALEVLQSYQWPGNVRELSNCIERIKVLKHGTKKPELINLEDIPSDIQKQAKNFTSTASSSPQKLEDMEREHILSTLQHFNGNKSKTSAALGVTLKTLYNKLNRYEVEGLL